MSSPLITIAIADDNTLFRCGVTKLIEMYNGHQVKIAVPDGRSLINALTATDNLPDICLLDINMPDMNGYETAVFLGREMPSIKVIALSMFTDHFPVVNMLNNGACAFVSKDTEPKILISVIDAVYENGYHFEGITKKHLPHGWNSLKNMRYDITPKEMQFLRLCTSNMSYNEIAMEMNVGRRTIENYRDSLFKKLGVNTRTALAILAMNAGLGLKAHFN